MRVQHESDSKLALSIVSEAGSIATRNRDRNVSNTKDSYRDIVTDVDLEIERFIFSKLETSHYQIIGEESFYNNNGKYAISKPDEAVWYVDPIDGTTNFANGLDHFAISIGLITQNAFLVGAINIPMAKELYFTYGTDRAFVNGKKLAFTKNNKLKDSLVSVNFSSKEKDSFARENQYKIFGKINDSSRGCIRLGSAAVNLCYTASGKIDATYGLDIPLWDVAAGLTIAEKAGCKIWFEQTSNLRCNFIVGTETNISELKLLILEGK
ncbi:MAG: hypothetical protein KDD45_07005 [Bdellovibrionales bacterium]|nr:hypothetical protein [Bdellovibrionales bacterium]